MPSLNDLERVFLGSYLGLNDNEIAKKSLTELRAAYASNGPPSRTGANTWSGAQSFASVGLNGNPPVAKAAAIAAPAAAPTLYSQAHSESLVTAINSIRTALKNVGITA